MKTVSKTLFAVVTVSASITTAHSASLAQNLYTSIIADHESNAQFRTQWAQMTTAQQSEFKEIETQNGTNYANELGSDKDLHTSYTHSNPQAVSQYNPPAAKVAYSGETQRPNTGASWTMQPGIVKESNPEGKPTNLIGQPSHLDGTHSEPVTPHLDGQHSEPVHKTATATPDIDRTQHLDGMHSEPVTPHLDGLHSEAVHKTATATPVLDRSTHLDSTVTDQERQNAQLKAAIQHANNLTNGKNGVTTSVTRLETDTKTQDQVKKDADTIRTVRQEQIVQGNYVQAQSQVISHNSTRIDQNSAQIDQNTTQINKNKHDIEDTRDDMKRGLNNAAAMTGLHYHSNDAYAISAGTANGDGAALAGGLSHSLTTHTAATAQASTSMDGGWMASVGFSGDF